MHVFRTHDDRQIAVDSYHKQTLNEYVWRLYSHDGWLTAEAATDITRDGVRTTLMLSRFLMSRILGRVLDDSEIVRRKRQKLGEIWDFLDKNLELV